jgi:two-component system cell cycle response regulator DivK
MSVVAEEMAAPPIARRKTVLVVDDNALIRRLIADFVGEMGWYAVEAASAAEAVEAVRQLKPDVVLMDIVMPGGTGLEALQQIRADREVGSTPVVAVTTLAGATDEATFLAAGFDGYISKPLDLKRFADVLRQSLA